MARHRRSDGGLDTFVVLSDVTIGLSFIMLIYALFAGIAATKVVIEANRRERQTTIRQAIVAEWRRVRADLIEAPLNKSQTSWIYSLPDGSKLARIDENASFQRIGVFLPQFTGRSTVPLNGYGTVYLDGAIKNAGVAWNELSYIQIHGLTSTSGPNGVAEAQARAAKMVARWQRLGFIQSYADHYRTKNGEAKPGLVPIQNVNAYGTGDLIYSNPLPDRVDIVLFFNDRGK